MQQPWAFGLSGYSTYFKGMITAKLTSTAAQYPAAVEIVSHTEINQRDLDI